MYLVHARKTYIEVLFGNDLPGGFSGEFPDYDYSELWKLYIWIFLK